MSAPARPMSDWPTCGCGCGDAAPARADGAPYGFIWGHNARLPRGIQTVVEALSHYVVTEGGCWQWTKAITNDGYAVIWQGSRSYVMAHRASYEAHVAPIPDGMTIDHLCRNRACINPDHLEPVTNRVNVLRGAGPTAMNAAKTECVHGHPFDDDNTYWRPNGQRGCRECRRRVNRAARIARGSDG